MKPDSLSQGQQKTREKKIETKKRGMKQEKKAATTKKGAKKPRENRPSSAGGPGVSERPPSPLLPLRQFVDNPAQMIEQLFQAIGREELDSMQPTILQGLPQDEVKQLCLKQLESMSKQDILDILSGCEVKEQKQAPVQDPTPNVATSAIDKKDISDVTKGSEAIKEKVVIEPSETLELFPGTEDMEVLTLDEPPSVSSEKATAESLAPSKKEGDLATNLTASRMELLELQLRRRAIKALLRSQKGPGEVGDDDDDDDDEEEEEIIVIKEEKI